MTDLSSLPRIHPRRLLHGIRWRAARVRNRLRARRATRAGRLPGGGWSVPAPATDRFRSAALARMGIEDLDAETDPAKRMWADFTLSTVERGVHALDELGGPSAVRGRRVLDVGCAYGGFLVAAAAAGAAEVVGIEVDPELAALGRLLLEDHGVEAPIHVTDLMAEGLPGRIGRFDVVFCNDVLEHVPDPEAAIARLAELVVDGGRLYVEVPNALHLPYVLADGHYKLFGITLLDFGRAERWFHALFRPGYAYRTYVYGSRGWYHDALSRHGFAVQALRGHVPDIALVDELGERFADIERRRAEIEGEVPAEVRDVLVEIDRRLAVERTRFDDLVRRIRETVHEPERVALLVELRQTYGDHAFAFDATRRTGPGR